MVPRITAEIFCFSHQGAHFVYAPLRRLLLRVNLEAIEFIRALNRNKFQEPIDSACTETLEILRAIHLVDSEPDNSPVMEDYFPFEPTEVTLFLTNQCNLRCIYCYASAGDMKPKSMKPLIGETAINTIVRNALKHNLGEIRLGFHGGGEPTLEWDLLVHLTTYCKKQAEIHGLSANISMATNGILSDSQVDWIVNNLSGLNLSLDGPQPIQDYQRPFIDGTGSFDTVYRTAKRLDQFGFPYGIRCTVTDRSVTFLEEITEFIGTEFRCSYLHVEPVFECGRCRQASIYPPDGKIFVEHFRRARSIANEKKLKLVYSGMRADVLTHRFCLAEGGAFCVTCDGDVTSCYEVTSRDDPLSKIFFIGQFNAQSKEFQFDTKRIAKLRRSKTLNALPCKECFCKYHCAGDCLAKRLRSSEQCLDASGGRCYINRELTKDQLLEMEEQACKGGKNNIGRSPSKAMDPY